MLGILVALFGLSVYASSAKISFVAHTNMPGVSVEGHAEEIKTSSGPVIEFDVFNLKTGMDKRDEHLREKVFAAKKPGDAVIRFEAISVPEGDGVAEGKLTIKGVEKTIRFPVKRSGGAVSGKTQIELAAFALPRPSFMGVKVSEKVDVTFSLAE
jgi:polyisoprenoid-binding protein YceI